MLHQSGAALVDEKVEDDVQRWRRLRQLLDPALGRVNALEKIVERQRLSHRDDDLAVEDEFWGLQGAHRLHNLRKIPGQRLAGLGLQKNLVAVAERQAAK